MTEVKNGDIIVGRYRVENLIAQGGFGDVYLAKRLGQETTRALKVLRRDTLGMGEHLYQEIGERFKIEAQLGARLNHPNVVKALDYGQDGEMQVLAMEYLPGGSLAERLSKKQPLPVNEAVRISMDIARGLAVLHELDVVHRDLKPSNILFDANGIAKISDLGLAQLPGGASLRSLNSSQLAGTWHPGTRAYMSPEQETSTAYLKSSSDIFSLGVILFEMLTGRNVKNLKPGTRIREIQPDTPLWLDELLAKMLAQNPALRPGDGNEILRALHAGAFHGQTLSASGSAARPQNVNPAAKGTQNRWGLILAGLAGILVLGVVSVFLVLNWLNDRAAPSTAAQTPAPQAAGADDSVIEYLVSSANSMLQPLNGTSKQQLVQDALQQHWQGWQNNDPDLGAALRIFGSQYNAAEIDKSCLDTLLLSAPVTSPSSFSDLLDTAEAKGLAPLTAALYTAAGDFQNGQKKALFLITDSNDTCGSDPCNWAATQYIDAGMEMPVYVFDLGGASDLSCLAEMSAGKYFAIHNQTDLVTALSESLQEVIHER